MATPVLRLGDLRKRYGETVALDGVSFTVGEGEMFGFVGPNGAGKTTTMRIVLGVLAADSGSVSWRGGPIGAAERRRIGYMPEERGLYPKMRVRDQLVYMARLHGAGEAEAGAAADRWLERLGIAERGGDAVEALSLGNQQRVQLAVALVHEPDLLVLDEPFSGLDPDGVDALSRRADRGDPRPRRAGDLLLAPARAGRAPLRLGRDHRRRADRHQRPPLRARRPAAGRALPRGDEEAG